MPPPDLVPVWVGWLLLACFLAVLVVCAAVCLVGLVVGLVRGKRDE